MHYDESSSSRRFSQLSAVNDYASTKRLLSSDFNHCSRHAG